MGLKHLLACAWVVREAAFVWGQPVGRPVLFRVCFGGLCGLKMILEARDAIVTVIVMAGDETAALALDHGQR